MAGGLGWTPRAGIGARAEKRSGAASTLARVSELDEIEEVDAIPVLAPEAVVHERSRALVRSVAPTVQTAAVAAGGFVAGVAVLGLAHRRRRDAGALASPARAGRGVLGRARRRSGKGEEVVQIVGTRSLLVDVHLLGRPARDR